jgi:hypothetical protein
MATFKSRVHTVNTRSSRLIFADLEAVNKERETEQQNSVTNCTYQP